MNFHSMKKGTHLLFFSVFFIGKVERIEVGSLIRSEGQKLHFYMELSMANFIVIFNVSFESSASSHTASAIPSIHAISVSAACFTVFETINTRNINVCDRIDLKIRKYHSIARRRPFVLPSKSFSLSVHRTVNPTCCFCWRLFNSLT